ncbi:MAG: hypothetical protein WDO74_30390 [Pseudomonadota bacterium]
MKRPKRWSASPVSLVAAPYREEGGEAGGAVGVIGPTRMDLPVRRAAGGRDRQRDERRDRSASRSQAPIQRRMTARE